MAGIISYNFVKESSDEKEYKVKSAALNGSHLMGAYDNLFLGTAAISANSYIVLRKVYPNEVATSLRFALIDGAGTSTTIANLGFEKMLFLYNNETKEIIEVEGNEWCNKLWGRAGTEYQLAVKSLSAIGSRSLKKTVEADVFPYITYRTLFKYSVLYGVAADKVAAATELFEKTFSEFIESGKYTLMLGLKSLAAEIDANLYLKYEYMFTSLGTSNQPQELLQSINKFSNPSASTAYVSKPAPTT